VSNFDAAYYRTILDTLPVPVFIVDNDVRIHDLNIAASELFGVRKREIYKMRGGDALHCLNSLTASEGCGRSPVCEDCIIRNSVASSLGGTAVSRKRMKFQIAGLEGKTDLDLLITANRLPGSSLVLLVLEDVTELTTLKSIVPICIKCRRVRDDHQYWKQVEQYFEENTGLLFSHGLCPSCYKTEMESLENGG
jgi:PAS domain-containing protein